ncbi:MAG: GGDEF domain-containing protein [Lachnospiraceae bacterium]|nr:GGDEF domain-containing protein [Lachnospiraceae bacterium]
MRNTKRPVASRVNYANVNIVRKTAGFLFILIPAVMICALLIFNVDILDIQVILPAISMEAAAVVFFVFSASFIPRARRSDDSGPAWFCRIFWLITANALMFVAWSVDFAGYDNVAFVTVVMMMAVIPMLDGLECTVLLIIELIWSYFMSLNMEDPGTDLAVKVGICLVMVLVSRYVYSLRLRLFLMRHRMGGITKDALVDPLTGLLNRRGFDRQVESIWPFCVRNDYKVALLIIDIDNFKAFNDEFGHPEGDDCLKRVSECIMGTAKRSTDIVSRIGGEEFIVFIQGNKEDEMVDFAETIRRNVERMAIPHSHDAPHPFVTVSIGLAIAAPRGMDINMLYEAADVELYHAKEQGRNKVSFSGKVKRRYSALA